MTSKSKNNKIIFSPILKFKIIEKTKKIFKKEVFWGCTFNLNVLYSLYIQIECGKEGGNVHIWKPSKGV